MVRSRDHTFGDKVVECAAIRETHLNNTVSKMPLIMPMRGECRSCTKLDRSLFDIPQMPDACVVKHSAAIKAPLLPPISIINLPLQLPNPGKCGLR